MIVQMVLGGVMLLNIYICYSVVFIMLDIEIL